MAAVDARAKLNPVERFLYEQAVPRVREGLLTQRGQLKALLEGPPFGPGRVDTFNPYKIQKFGFPPDGSVGTADFPSIWNQRPREGMHLHWDGDNTSVFERNISASMGAGATPVSIDLPRMQRVAAWLGAPDPHAPLSDDDIRRAREDPTPGPGELPVPKYPFPIDAALAAQGRPVYVRYCASCHDWKGEYVGEVDPIEKVRTDRHRLDSFTAEFSFNQNTLGAGHWWRFNHFRKTGGYANMPLDGLWARAPYLHNGSVPTLWDLLSKERPAKFYRGDDAYDPQKVGFRTDRERSDDGRRLFLFDVSVPGNGNGGHDGKEYGTELSDDEKKALIEYLKTL
jgi:cytochrome c5